MSEVEAEEEDAASAGECDAVLLSPLTEDTFLQNLLLRYKKDIIYTYVGNAVVSVNPCRQLPLYSAELARAYLARPPYTLPPHIYAIAAAAYRRVRDRNENQCIAITGESGSGKTEAARVCLQCVALAAAGAGAAAGALTAAGTLLEAFGNAATARNHNASRFGKLLDIELDFKGDAVGGHITHYLLEKGRVARVADGERNFHVFYQLLAGADNRTLRRLKLQRSAECYRILRGGGSPCPAPPAGSRAASPRRAAPPPPPPPPPAGDDRDHFAFTKAAMCTLGFEAEERAGVVRLLAFLLKLGNVDFQPAHNIDGTIGARAVNEYEAAEACSLVGVDAAALLRALGASHAHARAHSHTHLAHHARYAEMEASEAESEALSEDEGAAAGAGAAGAAGAARDALLGAVYSRLFTWLVTAVNDALETERGARGSLGILDVYGFECLAHNSLEQLVINYAAERVQAAALDALRREPRLYAQEGLPYREPAAPPADDAAPAERVLAALRDAAARGAGDAGLLAALARMRDPRVAPLPPHHFRVQHFAGAVTYCARGLAAAERDAVPPRVAALLRAAADPLLASLFPDGRADSPRPGRCGSPRREGSVCGRQRALVAALARRLAAAAAGGGGLRLVRCLRADAARRPRHFDAHLVRAQIRTQSVVEMAQLRRAGWCEWMCARDAVARYGVLRPGAGAEADAVRRARSLLRSLPIPSAEFAFGRTKVFVRSPRTVWELEALRAARVAALVTAAQRAWRRHRARLEAERRRRAAVTVQRAWRERTRAARAESGAAAEAAEGARADAAAVRRAAALVQRRLAQWIRVRYVAGLWARLPARRASPLCGAWPPCPAPSLLARADLLLRHLHHRWRCYKYRLNFDQTARNRMREKVTASILFKDRKQSYPRSVGHPFVGDYVRLRASAAWRRRAGGGEDRYVVFADVVGKVARASGRRAPALLVVSTAALLLLEPRTLRPKRRVPAQRVHRLSLSPAADDLLVVHVRAEAEPPPAECADAADAPGCAFGAEAAGGRRRGDLLVQTCHVLELATKLFLVVQNAAGRPPHVDVSPQFEANFGQQTVTVSFQLSGAGGAPRLLRRGSRLDVLL